MSKPHAVRTREKQIVSPTAIGARSSWPWRIAAVMAVSAQVVASICGVLLLFYWVAASIALID